MLKIKQLLCAAFTTGDTYVGSGTGRRGRLTTYLSQAPDTLGTPLSIGVYYGLVGYSLVYN